MSMCKRIRYNQNMWISSILGNAPKISKPPPVPIINMNRILVISYELYII